MEKIEKFRRVGLLCCHFIRNCAFYKAGWYEPGKSHAKSDFSINILNNFADIAVLEWTKLFGSRDDKHHWRTIASNPIVFKSKMLQHCNLTSEEFSCYRKQMLFYRDKYIAHLDLENTLILPDLTNAINTTKYYYEHIYNELPRTSIGLLPDNLQLYYEKNFLESKKYFDELAINYQK